MRSAATVLPLLFKAIRPSSVIDVGCGLGAWLKTASELGVTDILGLDGDYISPEDLLIAPPQFRPADLTQPIQIDRRFDLAISLEVAEHLPHSRSQSFVSDLVALSDVVLFSAATPYQGGTNHINEQWLEFWGILFRGFGYEAVDLLRPQIWHNSQVEFWYRQNLMVFAKSEAMPLGLQAARRDAAASQIHPMNLLFNTARFRPLAFEASEVEIRDFDALQVAYQSGANTLPALELPGAHASEGTALFPDARTLQRDPIADLAYWQYEIARRDEDIRYLRIQLEHSQAEGVRLTENLKEKADEITWLEERLALVKEALLSLSLRNVLHKDDWMWRALGRLDSLRYVLSAEEREERDVRLVRSSGLFDRDFYLSQASLPEEFAEDPIRHYVKFGAAEQRDPHALFSTSFYLSSNPDVARSGMNPLAHYEACGGAEGRDPHPDFHTAGYLASHPAARNVGITPLLHYWLFQRERP